MLDTFSPKNCTFPFGDHHCHVTHQAHSSCQTACWPVQPFLYGSQMLFCTMHCQWGRKHSKTAPSPRDFVTVLQEDRATAIGNNTEKLVKIARVVLEISLWTDRHTDRQTDTRRDMLITIFCSAPVGWSKYFKQNSRLQEIYYISSSQFIGDSVTTLPRHPSRLMRGWNLGSRLSGKSLKLLPPDVRF